MPANTPPVPPLNLAWTQPAQRLEALGNPSHFWRLTDQRLLVERRQLELVPDLARLVSWGTNAWAARRALLTLVGINALNLTDPLMMEVLEAGLKYPAPGVRRAALASLPRQAASVILMLRHQVLVDPEARVKKDALLTLSEMPGTPAAGEAIAAFLGDSRNMSDCWLPVAAISAAAQNELTFLKSATQVQLDPRVLTHFTQAVRIYPEHYTCNGSGESVQEVMEAYSHSSPGLIEALISGLATGWPMNQAPLLSPVFQTALHEQVADARASTEERLKAAR